MYFKEDRMVYGEDDLARAVPKAKDALKSELCRKHCRRPSVTYSYDDDGLFADVDINCCADFANRVAEIIRETKLFEKVDIRNQNL